MARRHGEERESAILDAAWAELVEVGYTRLTREAVAARAGTSKPVVYRRWPGRPELVLAACACGFPARATCPTGTVRDPQVFALLMKQVARATRRPPDLIRVETTLRPLLRALAH